MGETLFKIGLFMVIAAGIIYAIQRYNLLSLLSATKPAQTAAIPARHKGLRVNEGQRFVDRMATLPSDALLTLRTPDSGRDVKLQVISYERIECYGNGELPKGVQWDAVYCVSESNWTDADVLLLKTDEHQYVLKRRRVGVETCSRFQPYAYKFAHQPEGQVADSVEMPYGDEPHLIQDVGFWKVTAPSGRSHIPSTILCRWIIAHNKDGKQAIVVEDGKGNHDSVWEGWTVNLNRVIKDVLTEEG
jgi:hypothetical protein